MGEGRGGWGARQAGEKLCQGLVPKAAKIEFPLLPPGVAFTQGLKWKAKKAAEWEELMEWRYLAACCSRSSS